MASDPVVLVTGGAGYIGSHVVLALLAHGFHPVVLDNLSTGSRDAVPTAVPLLVGDVGDAALVRAALRDHGVTAVIHLAGSVIVPESFTDPLSYYENNTGNSLRLLEACVATGVSAFVFSSTAAVYGLRDQPLVSEDDPVAPISPYGRSKRMTELMLQDAAPLGIRPIILRYFNVAGTDPEGRTGQYNPHATHLIRTACQVALGVKPRLDIFGTDYATPDGTCLRDFIHVSDLAEVHVLALRHLMADNAGGTFNIGYGRGTSVRDIVRAVERVTQRPLPVAEAPRRQGDPPAVIARAERVRRTLGWIPRHDDLDLIIRTALDWERRLVQCDGTLV